MLSSMSLQPVGIVADVKLLNFFVDSGQVLQRQHSGWGHRTVPLQVDPEAAEMDVALVAVGTLVGRCGCVGACGFQVHKLGELGGTHLALVRFLSGVESQVGLEIAGAAKSLVANLQCVGREAEKGGWRPEG